MKKITQHMTGANILLGLLSALLIFGAFGMIFGTMPPGFEVLHVQSCIVLLGLVKLFGALGLWISRTRYIAALVLTGYLGGALMACIVIGTGFFIPGICILVLWIGMELKTKNFLHLK